MSLSKELENSLNVLKSGGVLLYPTDTIWGLGCDATRTEAVEKIYRIKRRANRKSMLILVDRPEMITNYVTRVPTITWELIEAATKPLTIIFPEAKNLAANLIAEDGSIGIRICKQSFCNQLIARFGRPVVSTSANFSGSPSPERLSDIPSELITQVDYAVPELTDTGHGHPSSIIKLGMNNEVEIIRE